MPMSSKVGEVSIVSALGWHPRLLTAAERFSTCVARNRVPNSSQRAFRRHTVRSARLDSVAPPHASRAAPRPAAAHCLCFLAAGTASRVTKVTGERVIFGHFLALHVHRPDFSSACGGLEMCGQWPARVRAPGGLSHPIAKRSRGSYHCTVLDERRATAEGATAGATSGGSEDGEAEGAGSVGGEDEPARAALAMMERRRAARGAWCGCVAAPQPLWARARSTKIHWSVQL